MGRAWAGLGGESPAVGGGGRGSFRLAISNIQLNPLLDFLNFISISLSRILLQQDFQTAWIRYRLSYSQHEHVTYLTNCAINVIISQKEQETVCAFGLQNFFSRV